MFPIHLNIFGSTKGFYEGIYFALAVSVAIWFAFRMARHEKFNKDDFMLLLMVALVSGVLGGSIFQNLFYSDAQSLKDVISDWENGFSITGAVIIGPFFTYLYCKWKKLPYWKLFALVVPALILGQATGRMGCFLNGDGHGTATDLPWAVQFPRYGHEVPSFELLEEKRYESDAWKYSERNNLVSPEDTRSAPVHPSQIYELLADLILFALLLRLFKQVKARDGNFRLVPLAYVGGYSLIRFLIEFTRADRELSDGASLSQMQTLLIVAMGISAVLFLLARKKAS